MAARKATAGIELRPGDAFAVWDYMWDGHITEQPNRIVVLVSRHVRRAHVKFDRPCWIIYVIGRKNDLGVRPIHNFMHNFMEEYIFENIARGIGERWKRIA